MSESIKRHLPYIIIAIVFVALVGVFVWKSNTDEALFDWTSPEGLELTADEKASYQTVIEQVKSDPADFRSLITLGNLRNKGGDPDGAIALYQKAIEVNPNDSVARNNLAEVYVSLGEYVKAEDQYLRIIELTPRWTEAYRDLVELYRYKLAEKKGQVPTIITQAIMNNPENEVEFQSTLGRFYWEEKDWSKALATYQRLQQLLPDDPLVSEDIATILREQSSQ